MEFVFEVLLQFLGEMLLQITVELLVELGFRGLAATVQQPKHPVLSIIGFSIWGAIGGGLSLLIFPRLALRDPALRMANVLITPLIAGLVMALVGQARLKRGQILVRMDRFGYAFTFAFWMAFIRFMWAA